MYDNFEYFNRPVPSSPTLPLGHLQATPQFQYRLVPRYSDVLLGGPNACPSCSWSIPSTPRGFRHHRWAHESSLKQRKIFERQQRSQKNSMGEATLIRGPDQEWSLHCYEDGNGSIHGIAACECGKCRRWPYRPNVEKLWIEPHELRRKWSRPALRRSLRRRVQLERGHAGLQEQYDGSRLLIGRLWGFSDVLFFWILHWPIGPYANVCAELVPALNCSWNVWPNFGREVLASKLWVSFTVRETVFVPHCCSIRTFRAPRAIDVIIVPPLPLFPTFLLNQ